MGDYVYVGKWRPEFTHYLDRLPELKYLDEPALMNWSLANNANQLPANQLLGCWVNSFILLRYVSAEVVKIVGEREEKLLTDHPQWRKWKDEFDAAEFYSFCGWSWVDLE